jgi:hypothetical protein
MSCNILRDAPQFATKKHNNAVSPSCGFHLQGLTQELGKDAGESDDAFAAVF